MRIPVVLTTVHAVIDSDGALAVDVDGDAYAADRSLDRSDLRSLLDEITTDLDAPVRVEVREADGTTYSDIHTPPGTEAEQAPAPAPVTEVPALAGTGFRPGEEVALAYVVSRQTADASGHAAINLPPALLAATRGGLVLLGLASQTVAPVEAAG